MSALSRFEISLSLTNNVTVVLPSGTPRIHPCRLMIAHPGQSFPSVNTTVILFVRSFRFLLARKSQLRFAFSDSLVIIAAHFAGLENSMNSLKPQDIQKIAELSKLDLPADKLSMIIEHLDDILKLVDKMDAADTKNIEPLAHPFHIIQPMREDIVTEKD